MIRRRINRQNLSLNRGWAFDVVNQSGCDQYPFAHHGDNAHHD